MKYGVNVCMLKNQCILFSPFSTPIISRQPIDSENDDTVRSPIKQRNIAMRAAALEGDSCEFGLCELGCI